jgi:hypothetical protein
VALFTADDVDELAESFVIIKLKKVTVMANRHPKKVGKVAKTQEERTSRIPSDVYLWAAVGTMALSLTCFLTRQKHASIFFGQWAPSLLIIGLYDKLVKIEGHDEEDKQVSERVSKARTMA